MNSPALSSIARGVPDVDLLRALAMTNRAAVERFIDLAIDILDSVDPDPDLKGHCDEEGLTTAFHMAERMPGPGCLIGDDDCDWYRDCPQVTS